VNTHTDRSIPHHTNDQTRATEIADLLTRLATLISDQPPDTKTPRPQAMPVRVLLTVQEAAERLHIGTTKTYALVKTGDLESVLIGRLRRIHTDALNAYATRLTRQQTTPQKAA
jgi:excisionase family DNA binding protein